MTAAEFKSARALKKMTQKELAAHLGVSLSAVTKWEGGAPIPDWVAEKMTPSASALKITGLSADEIRALEKRAAAKGVSGDALVAELIRSWIKLSVIGFLTYHFLRTPADWSAPALASTARSGLAMIAGLF